MAGDTIQTVVDLFHSRVGQSGSETALWIKRNAWTSLTWNDLARDVFRTAAWLVQCGTEPGDRVVQLSENRYEWIVADLAIHFARAVHVPIHAPLTSEQVAYQIRDSGARIVLLSTREQADKLSAAVDSLPAGLVFRSFDDCHARIGGQPIPSFWESLPDLSQQQVSELTDRAKETVDEETLATVLYTSGTTGDPKGVMLTHRNLVTNAVATIAAFGQVDGDRRLTFLPLSHIFARTCDLYTWVVTGSELALAESRESVLADCAALHPTLLSGVPYFFDKVMRVLVEQGKQDEPDALRDLLGGQIRVCGSGGAALPDQVFDFFNDRGVRLLQGYGLTESSPVITLSSETQFRRGAVGKPIPEVEVQIAGDGEILTRGPHIMSGYYKQPAATDEVLRDGWLHTGDLGHLDDDGYLFITGRKKELIVTSGGKNVAPVHLESLLTADPLILQAVVIGDARNYLTALIVPDPETLRREIAARAIGVTSAEQALQHPEVHRIFKQQIEARLSGVSKFEQVHRFTLLNRGFTIESGEMTPKMSLRREQITRNCCEEIEAMYRQA